MDKDKIAGMLEEFELKPEQIDEIMLQMDEIKKASPEKGSSAVTTESILKAKLNEEPDWRKRAAIAASIISHNLD